MKIQAKWDFEKMKKKYKGRNDGSAMKAADRPYKMGQKVFYILGQRVAVGYVSFFQPAFVGTYTMTEGSSFVGVSQCKGVDKLIIYRPELEDVAYPNNAGKAFLLRKIADNMVANATRRFTIANNNLNAAKDYLNEMIDKVGEYRRQADKLHKVKVKHAKRKTK